MWSTGRVVGEVWRDLRPDPHCGAGVSASRNIEIEQHPLLPHYDVGQCKRLRLSGKLGDAVHDVGVGPVDKLMNFSLLCTLIVSSPRPW
jgi:hypothetical protein